MQLRYVGPHAGVEVVGPDGEYSAVVAAGDTYETTTEHGKQLLEQPTNWERVPAKTKTTKGDS